MATAEVLAMHNPGLAKADLSIRFTEEQKRIILDTCCGGATESEARVLLAIAEARGLNPILQECYFVKRYDSKSKREVWAVQAAIDSLRIKAEQTGLYAGQDEPEYEYNKEGLITLARVKVWRRDWPRPAVGVARWDEYVQTTREGTPTRFWAQMPHNQLSKCAEALGLRKAFPAVLAKLYISEEMGQADNVVRETPQKSAASPQLPQNKPAPELPASIQTETGLVEQLCTLIDSAETKGALNQVASKTRKAHSEKRISNDDYVKVVEAHKQKTVLLSASEGGAR